MKVDTPTFNSKQQTDVWASALVEQLSKLRYDENFALEYNGRTIDIPHFPNPKSIDTAWYGSNVA